MSPPGEHRRAALYPNLYAWFVLTSALDIMLTHKILSNFAEFGAREVNTIADWFIRTFGLWGAIGLKFLTVVIVLVICEAVGRRRWRAGRWLARVVLVISCVPIAAALGQLALFAILH